MSDLIDRQEAYEVLTEYYHHSTESQHSALREALEHVPSAEPEQNTGEWIPAKYENICICSECGKKIVIIGQIFQYCPHCGARMSVC